MATYNELRSLFGEGEFQRKVEVALCIAVVTIIAEATPSATRLAWADSTLGNSAAEAVKIAKYVLASNAGLSIATIQGATDAAIQAKVNEVVDKLHP